MQAVVADTGPLNYLVLIGQDRLFPLMFDAVLVPEAVRIELERPKAPLPVRQWIASAPSWLMVRQPDAMAWDVNLQALDEGERNAIMLAASVEAELILMDDRAGVAAARARGLAVRGTIGLLDQAAHRGLIDIEEAMAQLRATNFYAPSELLDALLAQHRQGGTR